MSSERKVAVITGASRGIGAALVEAYRHLGYGVVATARSVKPTSDDQILVVQGDIADRKTAERAISEGLARFGRIDTLINNAGIFIAKPFAQYTEAELRFRCWASTSRSFFHITQLAIAEMEKRQSGHVVQITTSLIEHANSHVPSVLASLTKGGLSAATKSLAIERYAQGEHPRERGGCLASLRRRCIKSKPVRNSPSCTRSAGWARSRRSSTRFFIWNRRVS